MTEILFIQGIRNDVINFCSLMLLNFCLNKVRKKEDQNTNIKAKQKKFNNILRTSDEQYKIKCLQRFLICIVLKNIEQNSLRRNWMLRQSLLYYFTYWLPKHPVF